MPCISHPGSAAALAFHDDVIQALPSRQHTLWAPCSPLSLTLNPAKPGFTPGIVSAGSLTLRTVRTIESRKPFGQGADVSKLHGKADA